MKRNRELFYKIANKLEQQPELWKQDTYISDVNFAPENICNTPACIAGHAIVECDNSDRYIFIQSKDGIYLFPKDKSEILSWEDEARDVLGLLYQESDTLFEISGRPRDEYTVPSALRAIGDGAKVSDVWIDGWDA